MKLAGQVVGVLGAGRSGIAAARLALSEGAHVHVFDQNPSMCHEVSGATMHAAVDQKTAEHFHFDVLIISPGIDPTLSWVQAFAARARRFIGEMQFGWDFFRGKTVAITGTNGKTTTTELIATLLNAAGVSALPCGNYGVPVSEIVMMSPQPQAIALEASSFQLETIDRFFPDAVVWLNFAPDHMDRYPTVEAYHQAKLRILENESDVTQVIAQANANLPIKKAKLTTFSAFGHQADWFFDGNSVMKNQNCRIQRLEQATKLRGRHNVENIMAALALCDLWELDAVRVLDGLKSYVAPPHRCEWVRTIDDVEYVNDSKATNLHALESAVRSQTRPLVLLIGGKDKGLDYSPILLLLKTNVLAVIAFGQIAPQLAELTSSCVSTTAVMTLAEAVDVAHAMAPPGSMVLMSPGTSSFDQFQGYEHRGNVFRELVMNLNSKS